MRTLLLIAFLLLGFGLNGCQCSDKPDVPPTQEARLTAAIPSL